MRSSGIELLKREPCRNSAELVPAYEYYEYVSRKTSPFPHPGVATPRSLPALKPPNGVHADEELVVAVAIVERQASSVEPIPTDFGTQD